jgi:hypothetical protein
VIVHLRRTPPALRSFVIDAFQLVKVAERDGDELYVPRITARVTPAPVP